MRWSLLDVTEKFPELLIGYRAVLVLHGAKSFPREMVLNTVKTVKKLDLAATTNNGTKRRNAACCTTDIGDSSLPATARDIFPMIPSDLPMEPKEPQMEESVPSSESDEPLVGDGGISSGLNQHIESQEGGLGCYLIVMFAIFDDYRSVVCFAALEDEGSPEAPFEFPTREIEALLPHKPTKAMDRSLLYAADEQTGC